MKKFNQQPHADSFFSDNNLKDNWALVTGATTGIGREYCQQLAALGMSLIMLGRNTELLEQAANQLADQYNIKTKVITKDLGKTNAMTEIRDLVRQDKIKIKLLINNAALGSGLLTPFIQQKITDCEEMIHVNVTALTGLCRIFLPDLLTHKTSAIINVASLGAFHPTPYMAIYTATKSYIYSFSQALYAELKKEGVIVQTVLPGPTKTESTINMPTKNLIKKWDCPYNVVSRSLAQLNSNTFEVFPFGRSYWRRLASFAFHKKVLLLIEKLLKPLL